MKFTYLLINFFTIIVPVIFSFHPRIKFYKTWKAFFPAALLVGAAFIVWDILFTHQGIWRFNARYLTGINLFNLPIEEVLFFICIPFSCVFTYYCLDRFYKLAWDPRIEKVVCILFSLVLLAIGLLYNNRLYTMVTMISTAGVCLFLQFVLKVHWFGKSVTVYAILLIPFTIVNGLLTGTGLQEPVVLYNDAENLGIRFLSIPIEDVFYGFELILLNLAVYLHLIKRFQRPITVVL